MTKHKDVCKVLRSALPTHPLAPDTYVPEHLRVAHLRNMQENHRLADAIGYVKGIFQYEEEDNSQLIELCDQSIEHLRNCSKEIAVSQISGYSKPIYRCGNTGICHVCNFTIAQRRAKKMASYLVDWTERNRQYDARLLHATVHLPFLTDNFELATRVMRIAREEMAVMMQEENKKRKRLEYAFGFCGHHFGWDKKTFSIHPHLHILFAVRFCPWVNSKGIRELKFMTSRWAAHCRRLFEKCIPVVTEYPMSPLHSTRLSPTFANSAAKRFHVKAEYIDPHTLSHDLFYSAMTDAKVVINKHSRYTQPTRKTVQNTLAYAIRQPTFDKICEANDYLSPRSLEAAAFIMRRKLHLRSNRFRAIVAMKGTEDPRHTPGITYIRNTGVRYEVNDTDNVYQYDADKNSYA